MGTLLLLSGVARASSFKGTEWFSKNLDSQGCLPLKELGEKSDTPEECPEEFSPQIRPMTVGTLDRAKTEAKGKKRGGLCCYSWKTYGNR
jgi:hypothetical protein